MREKDRVPSLPRDNIARRGWGGCCVCFGIIWVGVDAGRLSAPVCHFLKLGCQIVDGASSHFGGSGPECSVIIGSCANISIGRSSNRTMCRY